MGKRSDFLRRERDCYDTPWEAVLPLLPFLKHQDGRRQFIEPCAGSGQLIRHLERAGHACVGAFDVAPRDAGVAQLSALYLDRSNTVGADLVITNPPWGRELLHSIIEHLRTLGLPAWLLIDANWAFTAQAAPYLLYCERIVTIGRVKWIPGTKMTGKDDCAWFRFNHYPVAPGTLFTGKIT